MNTIDSTALDYLWPAFSQKRIPVDYKGGIKFKFETYVRIERKGVFYVVHCRYNREYMRDARDINFIQDLAMSYINDIAEVKGSFMIDDERNMWKTFLDLNQEPEQFTFPEPSFYLKEIYLYNASKGLRM